ncbi:MAG: hypothetical protein MK182_08430 [Acidimicrobiales bacterium]|nr:hypothetical protein [Acidimicrobiales bacterium]
MNGVLRATLVGMLAVATACGGAASEATQKVTLLAADAPTEIVVSTTSTTSSTTTTTTTTAVAAETTIRTASETSVDGDYEDGPATTTTAEPVKETIPLAEEKVPPGIQMMDALEEFNGCLDEEGVEFIGRPDATLGEGALVNQPAYIKALTLCAARSGIISAMQEFQTSRAGRTPEKIREDNEQFIALTGCLRSRGWTVSDPMPNADGSLGPGDDFRGPDGDLDMDDIRSCISELSLLDDE